MALFGSVITSTIEDTTFSSQEVAAFNMIGHFHSDVVLSMKAYPRSEEEKSMICYHLAMSYISKGKKELAEKNVCEGFEAAKRSRKPYLYFLLMSLPFAQILYEECDTKAVQDLLLDCFQLIDALGRTIQHNVVGRLFYMRALIEPCTDYQIRYYELAIDMFNESCTVDKNCGMGLALCKLNIILLGCGMEAEKVDNSDSFISPSQVWRVKRNFDTVEKIFSQCALVKILHFMAESDYYCRTGHPIEAFERAKNAHDMASRFKLKIVEMTRKRLNVYAAKVPGEPGNVEGTLRKYDETPNLPVNQECVGTKDTKDLQVAPEFEEVTNERKDFFTTKVHGIPGPGHNLEYTMRKATNCAFGEHAQVNIFYNVVYKCGCRRSSYNRTGKSKSRHPLKLKQKRGPEGTVKCREGCGKLSASSYPKRSQRTEDQCCSEHRECPLCERIFANVDVLLCHIRKEHGNKETPGRTKTE